MKTRPGIALKFLLGWIILNGIIITAAFALSMGQYVLERSAQLKFPFQLYVIAGFISNFTYLAGFGFELLHLYLSNKPVELSSFQQRL